jgi:hypothetical protein
MRAHAATALLAAVVAWPALVGAAPPIEKRMPSTDAAYPVKPTGPIAVEYRLASTAAVGMPLEIYVTARVQAAASSLAIEANASARRAVLVTAPRLDAAGDGVYSWTITIVPLAAEAGYLSVIVAGNVDGVAQARSVTVPLRSSAGTTPTPATGAAHGEALIALPVQESP